MPAIVDCPSCNRKLRIPDELLGRKVKCPTCNTTFDAVASPSGGAPPAPPPPPPGGVTAAPPTAPPPPAFTPPPQDAPLMAHKRCPYCGENVPADQERCQHCGEALAGADRPWEQQGGGVRRDCEPHRGAMVLTFGIISICVSPIGYCCGVLGIVFAGIGLGLGIPAIIMGKNDLAKMRQGTMDPQGQGQTQAGWICGIIGTSLAGLGLLIWLASIAYLIAVVVGANSGRL
ncbi:MAG: hypothetical protein JNM56_22275 [Planctomycetia bacterium]|nr:hypothetical protein [Planctomycetia bacterium]